MKQNKYNKFLGMTAVALATFGLASCSNELNDGDFSGSTNEPLNALSLVKAPEVIAWSGDQTLGNTFGTKAYSTRSTDDYDWNFPAGISRAENIEIPSDAVEYNGSNQGSGTYYVPAGNYVKDSEWEAGLTFANNCDLTVYVESGAKVLNIGSNISSLNLYIQEGAEVTIANYSMNNCNIYNEGTLNLPKGFDGNKIQSIYNTGTVYVGKEDDWGKTLPDNVAIYSKGGYVEFLANSEYQNEYYYSQTLINGTIVSDNIVKSNGKIKFQSSGYRDICNLISTDLIEITEGTNIFGEIEGTDMKFDGAKITLHPDGYVHMTNEINMPNSGCQILAYDADSQGLVETKTLSIHLTNDPLNQAIGQGIYLQVESIYNQASGVTITDFSGYSTGSSNHINQGVKMTPACARDAENNPNDEGDENQTGDSKPELPEATSEVEVNLSINDVHGDNIEDFVSKLSIHVRYPNDVRIRIPVPAGYYIANDDLVILNKHEENLFAYGEEHVSTYKVNGKDVILTVEYDADGITVTTKGIDEDVFNYCVAEYGDGINFEVYNYFAGRKEVDGEWVASDLSVDVLQAMLNESTIEFIDGSGNLLSESECPDYYVNAFGNRGEFNGPEVPETGYNPTVAEDCSVSINGTQRTNFGEGVEGEHLNGTDKNLIYKNNSFEGAEGEHGHGFLWGADDEESAE